MKEVIITISDAELQWLDSHIKRTVMLDSIGFSKLTHGDRILGRIYLALTAEEQETSVEKS